MSALGLCCFRAISRFVIEVIFVVKLSAHERSFYGKGILRCTTVNRCLCYDLAANRASSGARADFLYRLTMSCVALGSEPK